VILTPYPEYSKKCGKMTDLKNRKFLNADKYFKNLLNMYINIQTGFFTFVKVLLQLFNDSFDYTP
jgi:hypothetical protein